MGWSSSSGGGAAPAVGVSRPLLSLVATRCHYYSQGFSDGVNIGETFRSEHVIAVDTGGISLVYTNFGNHSEQPGANDIVVKASLDYGGLVTPVFFGGKRSVTLGPGAYVKSDVMGLDIPAGTSIYVRTYVSVATVGQKWLRGLSLFPAKTEGYWSSDKTDTIDISGITSDVYGYTPCMILGMTKSTAKPGIIILGDSIAWGMFDQDPNRNNHSDQWGFVVRGLNGQFPWATFTESGARCEEIMPLVRRLYRGALWAESGARYVICEMGINDLYWGRTLPQLQSDLQTIWAWFRQRGIKVIQTTVTPYTTSTDAWATTANQTVFSGHAVRIQFNNWIRTTPAGIDGYFEVADTAESARNSGIWKPNFTTDGVHPNAAGHTAMATAINTTKFTV